MNKSKVFIGTINTANQAKGFAEALRSVGINADYWSFSNSRHAFGYGQDKVMQLFGAPPPFKIFNKNLFYFIDKFLKRLYFIKMLFSYNTFIFISPSSLFRNNGDLPILKIFKKKIIFVFCGCTERDPSFEKNNNDWICSRCKDEKWKDLFLCNDLNTKKRLVQYFEKNSDYIISRDDTAAFLIEKNPIWFYVFADAPKSKNYLQKFIDEKIRIVHFPSNSLLKQSHIIIPVLKRLEMEGKAEIILKDGIWPREKMLITLENSHILVDQIGTAYGVLGVEAMARGCVVLSSNDDWFMKKVPESPVYKTSSKTLYEDLVYLINHRDILYEYAERHIEFFHNYHAPKILGKFYKEKLGLR